MNKFNQLLLLVALSSHAAAESILIKNADIYTGKTVLPSTDLLIVDGRIAAIGNSSQKTDRVIDGSGKSISPGLFKCRHPSRQRRGECHCTDRGFLYR